MACLPKSMLPQKNNMRLVTERHAPWNGTFCLPVRPVSPCKTGRIGRQNSLFHFETRCCPGDCWLAKNPRNAVVIATERPLWLTVFWMHPQISKSATVVAGFLFGTNWCNKKSMLPSIHVSTECFATLGLAIIEIKQWELSCRDATFCVSTTSWIQQGGGWHIHFSCVLSQWGSLRLWQMRQPVCMALQPHCFEPNAILNIKITS